MVFSVAYHYFNKFQQKFNIPMSKMRLFPHYADDTIYSTHKPKESRFNVGIVGILPSLKGYKRSLELLNKLRKQDPRFRLHVIGKLPQDLSWVRSDKNEMDYYRDCYSYIQEHALADHVVFGGFLPQAEIYKNLSYLLSLSDIEAFHTAIAEGSCAGCMCLLLNSWEGVYHVYPKEYICSSLDELAERILKAATDDTYYTDQVADMRTFVIDNYGIQKFLGTMKTYLRQVFL